LKTHAAFLIVSADGAMRVVRKRPGLSLGEVAFRLVVNIPDAWARVVGEIKLDLPEPPEPEIAVEFA
jgi:hypothetical protein